MELQDKLQNELMGFEESRGEMAGHLFNYKKILETVTKHLRNNTSEFYDSSEEQTCIYAIEIISGSYGSYMSSKFVEWCGFEIGEEYEELKAGSTFIEVSEEWQRKIESELNEIFEQQQSELLKNVTPFFFNNEGCGSLFIGFFISDGDYIRGLAEMQEGQVVDNDWQNDGGGFENITFIKIDEDNKDCAYILQAISDTDASSFKILESYIDVSDDWIDWDKIESYYGGVDKESTIDKANAVWSYYGANGTQTDITKFDSVIGLTFDLMERNIDISYLL